MRISCRSELVVKESDFVRLTSLFRLVDTDVAEILESELEYANIVEDKDYPANAVCMGSRVTYIDLSSNTRNVIQLVYPDEANVREMKISVLSPVGCALIGLKKNCVIDWKMPNNSYAKLKVESVDHDTADKS